MRLFILKAVFCCLSFLCFSHAENNTHHIALTQITIHPSLDEIKKGIEDTLIKEFPTIRVSFDSAQGNLSTAVQITQKFIASKPSVIVAITTPSAQACYRYAKNAAIPVIYSAVSNPNEAKLTGDLITGVQDLPPLKEQLDFIKKYYPEVKRIGVLYNPSESNSVFCVSEFKKLCESQGIELIEETCCATSALQQSAQSLAKKVKVIFVTNDNLVVSSMPILVNICNKEGIALFVSDPHSVDLGAFGAIYLDQYQIGVQTAGLISAYLKDPSKLPPPQRATGMKEKVNQERLRALGISQVP